MRVAIIYATREGQTRRIAEYLAGAFHSRDVQPEIFDARQTPDPDLEVYDALVVAASVHIGKHEREMVRFVRRHRDALTRIPSAFLSVSMAQAGIEQPARTDEQRQAARREVDKVIARFLRDTGWSPRWLHPVAGALLYTRYNFLVRFIMKMISKASGGSTDTSRDHEYTDWVGLERLVATIIDELREAPTQPEVPSLRSPPL